MPMILDRKQYKSYLNQESDFNRIIESVSDSISNAKKVSIEGRYLDIFASYFNKEPNLYVEPNELKSLREENIEIFYFPKQNPIKNEKSYEIYKIRLPKYKNQIFKKNTDEMTAKTIKNNKYLWKKINSLGFNKIKFDNKNQILVMYS